MFSTGGGFLLRERVRGVVPRFDRYVNEEGKAMSFVRTLIGKRQAPCLVAGGWLAMVTDSARRERPRSCVDTAPKTSHDSRGVLHSHHRSYENAEAVQHSQRIRARRSAAHRAPLG